MGRLTVNSGRRRLAALALLALALAPGTWLRTEVVENEDATLAVVPLPPLDLAASSGAVLRTGLWELDSPNSLFGGYSAMMPLGPNLLRLFSDRGSMLTFAAPGRTSDHGTRFANVWNRGPFRLAYPDIESATRNPETGDYWLGFENFQGLIRYDIASRLEKAVQPADWQGFSDNSGVEAMVRLADGRFIVLPEAGEAGLLYEGDPADGVRAALFRFRVAGGYRPTDMAQLPDGRVLVLLRKLAGSMPPFSARLALADPADISSDQPWQLRIVADLDAILPRENYEGLSIAQQADGTIVLWVVSDDNLAAIQRTLLARLEWRPETGSVDAMEDAHEKGRRTEAPTP